MPEHKSDGSGANTHDEPIHSTQMVIAEDGSNIAYISQNQIQGDIINSTINSAGRDVINYYYSSLSQGGNIQASRAKEVLAACKQFDARLEIGLQEWVVNVDDTYYREPTLLWQYDIERNEFLRDPDAQEVWLKMVGKTFSVDLSALLTQKRVLVLGEFHMGKTQLLKQLCKKLLGQRESDPTAPIPIFLPLRVYHNPAEAFVAYMQRILNEMYGISVSGDAILLDDVLHSGHYLFLFDGLDELGGPQHHELLRNLRDFVSQYPDHSYILSSRRSAYSAVEAQFMSLKFVPLVLTPFSSQQVQHYLVTRRCIGTPLAKVIQERRDLLALARVPGLLKLLCDLWGTTEDIPQRLSGLYENLLWELLTKEIQRDTAMIPHLAMTRQVLDMLALEMTSGLVLSLSEDALEEIVQRLIKEIGFSTSYSAREWIGEIRQREILIANGTGVSFQHRSWQEYLTAHALKDASLNAIIERAYVVRTNESGFNPWWYQVLRFLAEMRSDILEALYEREEIIAARCTPLDADEYTRQRALKCIFSFAEATRMGLNRPNNSSDFLNDRQICLDLNPPGAVPYLRERYCDKLVSPVIRDDAFELLVDYAASDNDEAIDIVLELLPSLLSADEADAGLRETAAYAVLRLELREFVPQLLVLYDDEQDEHVRRAIVWTLATLAPQQARSLFSRLLIQQLGTRLPHGINAQALTIALPYLLDEQLIHEIKNWLLHIARDIVSLPESLVSLLVKHGTPTSQELLLLMSTHYLVASSLSQDDRFCIYQALAFHSVPAIQYLLEHTSEPYAAPREVARVLAWLLDEARLEDCRDILTSSLLPRWLINLTNQELYDAGKSDIAEQLALYRGEVITLLDPEKPPVRETLEDLLAQPNWQVGKAFSSPTGEYIAQVDSLSPERRNQLRKHIVAQLNHADFALAFRMLNERQGICTPYLLVCMNYAVALRIDVTHELYQRLLSIDCEDATISTLCEQSYSRERDEDIISWIHANAPNSCLLRAAALCGAHRIQPRRVVPVLGKVIQTLCTSKPKDQLFLHNIVYRLIQTFCRYDRKGANMLEKLINTVDEDYSFLLAQTRLTMSPPSIIAETYYLEHLEKQVSKGNIHLWDREMQYIQTPQAIPHLFALLRTLIVHRGNSADSISGVTHENSLPGVMPPEMKTGLLLTSVITTMTRLASAEVLQGYETLLHDFPDESWLHLYHEDARRVYLARQ